MGLGLRGRSRRRFVGTVKDARRKRTPRKAWNANGRSEGGTWSRWGSVRGRVGVGAGVGVGIDVCVGVGVGVGVSIDVCVVVGVGICIGVGVGVGVDVGDDLRCDIDTRSRHVLRDGRSWRSAACGMLVCDCRGDYGNLL